LTRVRAENVRERVRVELLRARSVTVRDVDGVWTHRFSDSLVLHIGVARRAQLVERLNDVGRRAR
jgi:hypothetical protein